ncbi:MAG TPA: SDR family oxidoreductase [Thermoanaerobaculia bacterium]|nr:SDR family oxidoreductase [Thermoanaerobaculia bacterium]
MTTNDSPVVSTPGLDPAPAFDPAPAVEPAGSTIFFTGFPGFIGRRLVRALHERRPEARWVFLVQDRLRERAEADLRELERRSPDFRDRWETVVGDITDPRLGLAPGTWEDLTGRVTEAWHLAAVYDLAVPEEVARRVNVDGTRHVLDFCQECEGFERLLYVSTCYVAGERKGRVLEDELDEGQGFKNHYESTKFAAEVEVQRRWDRIPTVVFRPAVVVGDSRTGETDKYDGPYYMMRLMMRLPRLVPVVGLGRGAARLNLVPVDWLVAAMVEIGSQEDATGRVYQLADPAALEVRELLDRISEILGKPKPLVRLPGALIEGAMSFRPLRQALEMPKETIVYANHPVAYDVQNTLDALEGTGIECPPIASYLPVLIDYVRRHPEKEFLDKRY